jgi:hypothetical protein
MVFDTDCRGLGLRATANGSKVFIVQWTDAATGRKVREPLGDLGHPHHREGARGRAYPPGAGWQAGST